MDRRTLTAMALCFLIFLGWQKLYIEPHMPHNTGSAIQNTASPGAPVESGVAVSPAPSAAAPSSTTPLHHLPESRKLVTEIGEALLGDGNRAFVGWDLKSYKLGIAPEAAAVDLKSVTNQDGQVEFAFDDPALGYLSSVQGTFVAANQGTAWQYEDANLKLRREFQPVAGEPYLNMTVTAEFKAKRPSYFFLSLTSQSDDKDPEAQDRQLLYWSDKNLERVSVKDSPAIKDILTPVKYVGAANRYFLMTLVPQGPLEPKGQVQPIGPGAGRLSLVYPVTANAITIPVRVYFGPKALEMLRRVDPALDNTVDLGWFQAVAYPLLTLLKFFYRFIHNYGLAIILLTLLIKLVTYPLNYKSMKSMKDMARLQPQLQKLRDKYKDDKEALNREMLTVMRTHGYNPAAGCLPILIQMPIFFALYRVLYSSIELFHAPFAFWIQDLAARDPFYVTPVLLCLTMFLQQKLSPQTATDPAQQKMMQFMPLIFGVMMVNLPSGLTIYMLTNALASIAQQLILNKKLDVKSVPAIAAGTR
ncbi:membrane protein insertase YidC [Bdellovibrionota bacterium FG-1]